jgi:hypothetical protein
MTQYANGTDFDDAQLSYCQCHMLRLWNIPEVDLLIMAASVAISPVSVETVASVLDGLEDMAWRKVDLRSRVR